MAEIRVKNIYYMLSYAFQSLKEMGFDTVASEEFDNLHDLFAAILARGVGVQIKRGLHRDYIQREEALAGLRGQIKIAETIKRQTRPLGRLVCSFDEFSPDSPHNQALKAVMLLLLRHGRVKPERKKILRKLLFYFSEVAEIDPAAVRWSALQYHRNNASYRMLLGLCQLVVKGLLLTTEKGVHRLSSWLQDKAMHGLYQQFVLAYYVRHHAGFRPRAAYIPWDTAEDGRENAYLPVMKSDIILRNGERCLIIDTKYYSRTMQFDDRYNSQTYISGHLYQIYTYVKNSEKSSTGNVAGMLLYAKTDEAVTPDEDMVIGGNRISLKTLDLNHDWNAITKQLDGLCEWLDGD